MRRLFLLTLVLSAVCFALNAQTWFGNSLDGNTYRNGNVGIGISTPSAWFTGKTFEMYDSRPIIKLNSSNQLSTILFTNAQVNSSTHYGEFHFNHRFNETDPTLSALSISSYPSSGILFLRSDGNVGIGTNDPKNKLHVSHTATSGLNNSNDSRILGIFENQGGARILLGTDSNSGSVINFGDTEAWNAGEIYYDHSSDQLRIRVNNQNRLWILNNGNVGIGTSLPTNKLEVNGTIRSKEVKVEASPWPDYVFTEEHVLPDLQEVNTYIQQNGHLPEIPTAKEVEENGISLGEMNAKLLQKIEELTLYTIEQQKQLNEQSKMIEELKSEIQNLK